MSNRFTCDVAEFSPVNHENHLVIHTRENGILIQGLYENVMEHASFLIQKNRTFSVRGYKNRGLFSELYMVSQ